MRTLALDENGDTYLDAAGNVAVLVDLPACEQCCKTAVQAQLGEMKYAINDGMPTRKVAFDNYDPVAFETAARNVIGGVSGVTGVRAFAITRQGAALRYSATIETIYGVGTVNG